MSEDGSSCEPSEISYRSGEEFSALSSSELEEADYPLRSASARSLLSSGSETEKGYHSDGRASDTESDFSANVSGFGDSSEQGSVGGDGDGGQSLRGSEEEEEEEEEGCVEVQSETDGTESPFTDTDSTSTISSHVGAAHPTAFITQGSSIKAETSVRAHPQTRVDFALIQAARTGDVAEVEQLIRNGCDLNVTDASKRTALHIASAFGRLEIVQLLIEAGSNIDACSSTGKTPLHEASIGGHYDILQELISEVSDLDAVDVNGLSAAHYCALNGEAECLDLLCNQGCDVCLEDKLGRNGVHLAALKDHGNIVQCLLERGMELHVADYEKKTPAHYAAKSGSLECLKVLVRNAVDMSAGLIKTARTSGRDSRKVSAPNPPVGDHYGVKPIHEAAYHNQLESLKLLLKKGGRMTTADGKGRTVLHKAASGGALTCLHWLLESGAKVNSTDSEGWTALHCAAAGGHSECFYCLLQHGASPGACSLRGENALDIARRFGKPRAIGKAVEGEKRCEYCEEKMAQLKLQSSIHCSPIRLKINSSSKFLFTNPVAAARLSELKPSSSRGTGVVTSRGNSSKTGIARRNLAAKYYGPPVP